MVEQAAERAVARTAGSGRRFLLAATASFYGDWLTTVGLVVLLYQMTGSTAAPAGYVLVRLAPRILGAGPSGGLADRFGPTRVIAGAWVLQGLITLALIPVASTRSLIGIYIAVAAAQFLNAIARPCMTVAIPLLVPNHRLRRFNGMFAAADSTSLFIAPAIGSSLLFVGGVPLLLLLDGVSFLGGAILVASLPVRRPDTKADSSSRGTGYSLEGAAILARDPLLRTIAAAFLAGALGVAATQSVMVVVAADRFGGESAVGWLYSAVGGGALIASVVLIMRPPKRISRRGMAVIGVAEVGPLGVLAYVHGFGVAVGLLALSAGAGVFSETLGSIDLQERVPQRLLGRVNAALFAALYLGMIVGAGSGVLLAPLLQWDRMLVVVGGVGIVIIVFAAIIPSARRPAWPLKDFPE